MLKSQNFGEKLSQRGKRFSLDIGQAQLLPNCFITCDTLFEAGLALNLWVLIPLNLVLALTLLQIYLLHFWVKYIYLCNYVPLLLPIVDWPPLKLCSSTHFNTANLFQRLGESSLQQGEYCSSIDYPFLPSATKLNFSIII